MTFPASDVYALGKRRRGLPPPPSSPSEGLLPKGKKSVAAAAPGCETIDPMAVTHEVEAMIKTPLSNERRSRLSAPPCEGPWQPAVRDNFEEKSSPPWPGPMPRPPMHPSLQAPESDPLKGLWAATGTGSRFAMLLGLNVPCTCEHLVWKNMAP
jgi:hypothetical protein